MDMYDFYADEVCCGRRLAIKKNLCGYADEKYHIVIDAKYSYAENFIGDFAVVNYGGVFDVVSAIDGYKNGYTVIDIQGKEICTPKYTYIKNYDGKVFAVREHVHNIEYNMKFDKLGVMNNRGEIIVEPQENISDVQFDAEFNYIIITTKSNKKGIYNMSGKELIPCIYDEIKIERKHHGKAIFNGIEGELVI